MKARILPEVRRKRWYTPPSEVRRLEKQKAIRKARQAMRRTGMADRPLMPRSSPDKARFAGEAGLFYGRRKGFVPRHTHCVAKDRVLRCPHRRLSEHGVSPGNCIRSAGPSARPMPGCSQAVATPRPGLLGRRPDPVAQLLRGCAHGTGVSPGNRIRSAGPSARPMPGCFRRRWLHTWPGLLGRRPGPLRIQ